MLKTDVSYSPLISCWTVFIQDLMPGGVNSPVRAFKSVGGQPIVIDSVLATLAETMKKGTSVGAPCLLENTLAEMVISAVPSIEMIRSVNSGTEACMGALRLARAFTGKQKIIKFEGCSHAMLILFLLRQGEIAALILEPAVGNSGFIVPKLEFLDTIRKIIKENNALLIFDEVMTGFQLSYGGAQEYFGIVPDLKTLGNIIVSGLPVGAYGEGTVFNFTDAKKSDLAKFASFYRGMLEQGVYFASSQFEAGFTSLAHTTEDIKMTIAAAERVLRQIG
ncbi:Glutamate-1-semialdehyde 2,1-aminomutase, chloroplastic [Glycine soja]|uniref:Glutamate-1-semialdehyde 2,1-aminomutase, chloroplastic n=1 Tax=Glycine soja TaxID=3848 RepID=A0A445HAY3_GLYSO|nr:Glutamate-1-semialdehyde 2,1-aminomutase, chloroplastic [Glycine soja]